MSPSDEDPSARVRANLRLVPLTALAPDPMAVHRRLLGYARRGLDDPAALSRAEVSQVCYALVVHYAQVGLS